MTITMKDAREKTIAAGKKLDEFTKENGIEDANELNEGGAKAQFKAQFDTLYSEFQAADKDYGVAQKLELEAGKVPGARERLSELTQAITGKPIHFDHAPEHMQPTRSPGTEFVESESYKALKARGALENDASRMSLNMDPVVTGQRFAATDEISTGGGSNAEGLVTPNYLPGILPFGQRPLTVRELFSNARMSGDLLSYARQTGFDNAAAAVAQAASVPGATGAKPQSSVAWARETAPATTIATFMVATRQFLADVDAARSLIDNQGRLMIQIEEEDQLLSGNGVSPNLEGIQSIATVQTFDVGAENSLDGIRHTRTMVRTGSSRLQADAIVMHPDDAEAIDLLKDLNGLYRGGNPIGNFTFDQRIWSLRRVESEGVSAGTAIVGAFKAGATVFERQPLTVYTSDSHSDFFVKNLIAVLFEERIAFPVFFPTAFVVLTLGSDLGVASGDEGIVSD